MLDSNIDKLLQGEQAEIRRKAFAAADAHYPLVRGGQGRSAEAITKDTHNLALITVGFVIFCALLPFLVGCAYSERDAANQLNVSKKAD